MQQPESMGEWAKESGSLVLRSPHTNVTWPLTPLLLAKPWDNPHRRRFPGRLSQVLTLSDLDSRLLEFHLIAKPGFHTFCSFLPRGMAPPAWPSNHPEPQQPTQLTDAGVKRCAWLSDDGSEEGGEGPAAKPEPAARPSYMIMSPFFDIPAEDYASLLVQHVRYHERLGATRYLAYTEGGGGVLALDPRIQELMAAGKLRIVEWEELPHHFDDMELGTRHVYASQSLVYNHALLALWHEDVVAAIADVDEYLMTPQKTTMEEVLRRCALTKSPRVAAVNLLRRIGYCTGCCAAHRVLEGEPPMAAGVALRSLNKSALYRSHGVERGLWLNASAAGDILAAAAAAVAAAGGEEAKQPRLTHPLSLYGMSTGDREPKSLVAIRHIAQTNPHTPLPMPGWEAAGVHTSCAYWLHLRSQLAVRLPRDKFTDVRSIKPEYMWVLGELQEA